MVGAEDAASARSIEEIERTHAFNICVQLDNMPFSDQTGGPRGALVDLGKAVSQRLNADLKLSWIVSAEYVRKTDCDAVPAVAAIPSDDALRLSIPYMTVRSVLVVRSEHPKVRSIKNIRGEQVAVLANSWARHLLNKAGVKLQVRYLNNEEILQAVADGGANAGVVTLPAYDWYRYRHPEATLRAETGFVLDASLDYPAAFGLRYANDRTTTIINEALATLISDGTIQRIFASYGLRYEPPSAATMSPPASE